MRISMEDIDIDGDMLRFFELRGAMKDFHLLVAAWRFIQPLLFGQVHTNKRAIGAHYDIDPTFFLSFLDPETPCYTSAAFCQTIFCRNHQGGEQDSDDEHPQTDNERAGETQIPARRPGSCRPRLLVRWPIVALCRAGSASSPHRRI